MMETEGRTINIPIDEYFDLRTKAEMNAYIMNTLGQLEGRMHEFDRRLYDLEDERKRV